MHRQLGLDLEAARQRRKRLHEAPGEHPVARQHVGEGLPEHVGDKAGQQPVAGAVAEAIGGLLAIDPDRADHVEPLADQLIDHGAGAGRIVGGIAINQHVDVGVNVGEHAPHHAAFALVLLAADDSAGLGRSLHGAIGGVVVVDVDGCFRQRRPEIGHDLADGRLLVVARHQHRDPAGARGPGGGIFRWQHLATVSHRPSHRPRHHDAIRHVFGMQLAGLS